VIRHRVRFASRRSAWFPAAARRPGTLGALTIPSGTVDAGELRKVVLALLALQGRSDA
jgi:hypothetical protein